VCTPEEQEIEMSTEDRSHRLRLLALSRKMTARRPPMVHYAVLAALAVFALSYEVRLTYQNLPEWFGRTDAPTLPFFAEDIGTEPITIFFLTHEAAQAGLKSGDELVAVNGRPVVGTFVFGEAMHNARAGDVLRVTVRRRGELRTGAIILRSSGGHHTSVWYVTAVSLLVVVPLLSLGVGFWVAFVRPRDPLAWLLLTFLAFFAVFYNADAEQWGPVVRDLAVIYRFGVEAALPIGAVLFGIYFPEPFPRRGRWLWWYRVMWLLIVPTALLGLASTIDDVGTVENRAAVMGLDRVLAALGNALPSLLFLACSLVFFAALAVKWKLAASADSKRRLSLMFWGTVLGLGPVTVLQVIAGIVNKQLEIYFHWWVFVPAYLLTALVPVTFAYVIVVQRAMDVRLVVRQGLRYALARNGILVLQFLLTAIVVSAAATLLAGYRSNSPQKIVTIAVGLALVFLLRRGAKRLRDWVDHRFFRDAYNAEQILSELGDQVRTMVETRSLLETVAGRIAESLHVPRVAVLLNGSSPYRPVYSLGYPAVPDVVFAENAVTVQRLKKEREPARVYFQDPSSWIYREPEMTDEERASLAELEAELLLPLTVKDKLIGFMTLAPKLSEEPYTGSDLRLLKSLAAQTGLALEVARLTTAIGEEIAQRERLNRELEIAREVQERLFPQHLPAIPGIDYCGRCRPAREVGGDYYDFLELPEGKLGVAIGDVSGKGIGAALMMAALEASLRGQATLAGGNLGELIGRVNRLVYEASSANRYATFFYAQHDPKSLQVTYVNAGHNPPLVLRKSGAEWQVMRLEVGGAVVGLLKSFPYQQGSFALQPGDLLLLFTDGVSEAMNPAYEEWGEERLIEAALSCDGLETAEVIARIMSAADAFAAGAPQHDDMTLVALRVLPNATRAN
jgi:phosphoserine phosphatase RsbU/P